MMTRSDFLSTLDWHDGEPPNVRPGMVVKTRADWKQEDGTHRESVLIVGDINGDLGECGCCQVTIYGDIVAWAEWLKAEPESD